MKALFIGGTGTISTAVTALAREKGWEVTLLNRGSKPVPEGMESMIADIHDEAAVARIMDGYRRLFTIICMAGAHNRYRKSVLAVRCRKHLLRINLFT